MLDFTRALYLGLHHPSTSLRPWTEFTRGAPSALTLPTGARTVAQGLAVLLGCESAVLGPSTLHLVWDLFGMINAHKMTIYMDARVYRIVRWGIERALARGVSVRQFAHRDPQSLQQQLNRDASSRKRPLVVTDGFCPTCGGPAPIAAYLKIVRAFGGRLFLDDTQSLGILGQLPREGMPYGHGGGGVLRWSNVSGNDITVVSSLAKGFGVPIAVLAASTATIQCFEDKSDTQMHCSPSSIADIRAAEHALTINRRQGDALRRHLTRRVVQFRHRLARIGLSATGGPFPVQTLHPIPGLSAVTLQRRMMEHGIRTVLSRDRGTNRPCLSFLLTARHRNWEIDYTMNALEKSIDLKSTSQLGRKISHEVAT